MQTFPSDIWHQCGCLITFRCFKHLSTDKMILGELNAGLAMVLPKPHHRTYRGKACCRGSLCSRDSEIHIKEENNWTNTFFTTVWSYQLQVMGQVEGELHLSLKRFNIISHIIIKNSLLTSKMILFSGYVNKNPYSSELTLTWYSPKLNHLQCLKKLEVLTRPCILCPWKRTHLLCSNENTNINRHRVQERKKMNKGIRRPRF